MRICLHEDDYHSPVQVGEHDDDSEDEEEWEEEQDDFLRPSVDRYEGQVSYYGRRRRAVSPTPI